MTDDDPAVWFEWGGDDSENEEGRRGVSDIVTFIEKQLALTERRAQQALNDPQSATTGTGVRIMDGELAIMPSAMSNSLTMHFVMNSPKHVLAEVAAKRAILALHEHAEADDNAAQPGDFGCQACHYDRGDSVLLALGWCDTLKLMAAPYADAEGYDPDWRVT